MTEIEVDLPMANIMEHEKVVEVPVEWERIVQKGVPIEKVVEVEVEKVVENPVYREKVVEVPVQHDHVIEEKYEVLVPNIVEVQIEKEIRVPQKTSLQQPVENMTVHERPIHVNRNETVPVDGGEFEEHYEVFDDDLRLKTGRNRDEAMRITERVNKMKREVAKLSVDNTPEYNNLVASNARLRAELSELVSRLNLVDKDKQRYTRNLANRTIKKVQFTVQNGEIKNLANNLGQLVEENKRLMSQIDGQSSLPASIQRIVQEGPVLTQVSTFAQPPMARARPLQTSSTNIQIIKHNASKPISTNIQRTTSPSRVVEIKTTGRPALSPSRFLKQTTTTTFSPVRAKRSNSPILVKTTLSPARRSSIRSIQRSRAGGSPVGYRSSVNLVQSARGTGLLNLDLGRPTFDSIGFSSVNRGSLGGGATSSYLRRSMAGRGTTGSYKPIGEFRREKYIGI
jgi:HAMP domain-containing protein